MNPTSLSAHRDNSASARGLIGLTGFTSRRRLGKTWKLGAALMASGLASFYASGTARAATDTWTGFTNSNWSSAPGDKNFTITSEGQAPVAADTAVFGDAPSTLLNPSTSPDTYFVNVSGTAQPTAAVMSDTAAQTYTFFGTGGITTTGTSGLTKTSTGTLILDNSGNNVFAAISFTPNSSGGTIQIGNNDANGNLGTGTGVINATGGSGSSGTLSFLRTDAALVVSNNIQGNVSVVQNGTGAVTLSGTDTYSANTTVNNGGSILLGSSNLKSNGTLVNTNGTFDLKGFNGSFGLVSGGTVGSSSQNPIAGGFVNNSAAGTATLSIASTSGTVSATYLGVIENTGGNLGVTLNLTGAGTNVETLTPVDVNGNATANTFTGLLTLTKGTLAIGNDSAIGAGNGANVVFGGGILQLNAAINGLTNGYNNNGSNSSSLGFKAGQAIALQTSGTVGINAGFASGSSSLTVSGGLLVVNPNISGGASNTYTGGTTLTGGELSIGASSVANDLTMLGGATPGQGNLTFNGGTLQVTGTNTTSIDADLSIINTWKTTFKGGFDINNGANVFTINTPIANTGGFSKSGAGTLISNGIISGSSTLAVSAGTMIINGNNTYSGATTVSGGLLQLGTGNANALGGSNSAATTLTVSGGLLDLNGNSITVGGLTGGGSVDNTSSTAVQLKIGQGNASSAFTGLLTNSGGGAVTIAKVGFGTFTLSNVSNTFSGGTSIIGGTVATTSDAALGTGPISFAGGVLQFNNYASSLLKFGNQAVTLGANVGTASTLANGFLGTSGSLNYVGPGTLNLTGNNGYGGGTTISGGVLGISADGSIGTGPLVFNGGTLQLNNASGTSGLSFTTAGTTVNLGVASGTTTVLAGSIQGAGTKLIYNGPGTLALTSNNNAAYNGTTQVAAGTLQIGNAGSSGAIGSGAVSVLLGANLAFDRSSLLTVSNVISGAGTVSQIGSGTTLLNNSNSYTGGTNISAGTLSLGNVNSLGVGTLAGALTMTGGALNLNAQSNSVGGITGAVGTLITSANATLTDTSINNTTFAGTLAGNGLSIKQAGTGVLTLTGTNTYSGGTTFAAGTIAIASDAALGNTAGALTFSGGLLQFNGTATALNFTTNATAVNLAVASGVTTTDSGNIQGSTTSLTFNGPGILALAGAANTYGGATTIKGGELSISAAGNIGGGAIAIGSTTGGSLQITGTTVTSLANTITYSSASGLDIATAGNTFTLGTGQNIGGTIFTKGGAGNLVIPNASTNTSIFLNGTGTVTIGNVASLGTGNVTMGGSTLNLNGVTPTALPGLFGYGTIDDVSGTNVGLNVTNTTATPTFAGTIQNSSTGTISLTKAGAGTLTLSGSNSFGGGTAINAGVLAITNDTALGSGAITFGGGTLTLDNYTSAMNLASSTLTLGAATNSASTLSGVISDVSVSVKTNLTYNGPGILVLAGTNTYTGTTTIQSGTSTVNGVSNVPGELSISSASNIGTGAINFNGGTLQITGTTLNGLSNIGSWTGNNSIDVNTGGNSFKVPTPIGGTNFSVLGAGTLVLTNATNAWTGTTTISASSILQIGDGGADGSLPSTTTQITNSGILALNSSGLLTIVPQINGSGTLVMQGGAVAPTIASPTGVVGTGIALIKGSNNLTGGVSIIGGTLRLGSSGALGNATNPDSVSLGWSQFTTETTTLDLNGFSPTIGGLSGNTASVITNGAATPSTLSIGQGGSTSNAPTEFDGTINNGTGGVAVQKVGAGILILTGNNTYAGGTTIQQGTIAIGNDSALGTGAVAFNGGSLQFNGYSSSLGFTNQPVLSLGAANGTPSSVNGNIVDGAGKTGLTFVGPGTMVLTGNNSYSGGTTISGGILQVGTGAALTASQVGTGKIVDNASLSLNYSSGTFANVISGTGSLVSQGGIIAVSGNNSYTGGTTISAGTLIAGSSTALGSSGLGGTTTVNGTLDVNGNALSLGGLSGTGNVTNNGANQTLTLGGGNGNGSFFGTIANGAGTIALTKVGGGNENFNSANTYSGGTNINNGTITITADNQLGSGPVNFNGGALVLNNYASNLSFAAGQNVSLAAAGASSINSFYSNSGSPSSGSFTMGSTGILTLVNANYYTGGSTINSGGTVFVGNSLSLGSNLAAPLVVNGSLKLNGNTVTVGALSGSGTVDDLAPASSTLIAGFGGASSTFTGNLITNFGLLSFTKVGAGTLTLNPANPSTAPYIGATSVNGGVLAITTDSAISSGVGGVSFGGGTLQLNNYSSGLNFSNFTNSAGTPISAANVNLGAAAGTASALTGNITDIASGFAQLPTDPTTSLTFVGPGTLALSGVNAYSGTTTISGGALVISADTNIGTGAINFGGGTLQFAGTNSSLNFGGTAGVQNINLGVAAGVTTTLNGTISGAGTSLSFNGPGILALTQNNTYGGSTNLNGGELSVTTDSNFGGTASAVNFNGGTLQIVSGSTIANLNTHTVNWGSFNGGLDIGAGNTFTVSQNIGNGASNGGALTKLGAGTLVLSGTNTFTGGTTIVTGTLQLGSQTALGSASSPLALTLAGGVLDLNGFSPTVGKLSGTNGAGGTSPTIDNLNSPNPVTLTINQSSNTTYAGTIAHSNFPAAGAVSIVKSGTGTLVLTGNNSYQGTTTLNGGVLAITQDSALGAQGGAGVSFGGGTLQLNSDQSNLTFGAVAAQIGAGFGAASSVPVNFITGTGSLNFVGPGTLNMSGANGYTGGTTIGGGILGINTDAAVTSGALTFNGGTLQLNNFASTAINVTGQSKLALGAASGTASSFGGTIADGGTPTNLTYNGPGILALTATNTYSGTSHTPAVGNGTTLNGGELSISELNNINYSTTTGTGANLFFNGGILQITGNDITGVGALAPFTNNVNWTGFNGGFDIVNGPNSPGGLNSVGINNAITGAGTVAKLGAGLLQLSASNTYTGGTILNGGTLQAGIAGNSFGGTSGGLTILSGTVDLNGFSTAVGLLSGSGVIDNTTGTGSVVFTTTTGSNSTYAGTIQNSAGTLGFTKGSTGTLTLTGNNTYTGPTNLTGQVILGSATALGQTSGVTLNAATILNLNGNSLTLTGVTPLVGSNSGTTVITSSPAATLTINNSGATPFTGTITGALSLVKNGAGVLTLNNASTYTGTSTINAGQVVLGSATALGAATDTIIDNAPGGTGTGINLNGQSPTWGGLTGSGVIDNSGGSNSATKSTVTINTSGSTTFNGLIQNSTSAATVSLTKSGTGTLFLAPLLATGNTYSGTTTIAAGTLAITADNALGSSTLSFTGGALQFVNYNSNFVFNNNTASLTLGAAAGTPSTLSGPITGTTALTFAGPGTLVLNGNNNFTGGTNINGGELSIANLGNVGQNQTNNLNPAINFNGGLLQITGTALPNLNAAVVNGGGPGSGSNIIWGSTTGFNGGFDIVTAPSVANGNYVFTVSQSIFGTNVTKTGAGTMILTSINNNWTGTTTINGGILQVGDGGADGTIGKLSGSTESGNIVDNGTLILQTSSNLTLTNTISGTGAFVMNGTGTIGLTGTNTFGVPAVIPGNLGTVGTTINSGLLTITSDAALGLSSTNGNPLITFGGTPGTAGNPNASGILQFNPANSGNTYASNLSFGAQTNVKLGVLKGDMAQISPGVAPGGALYGAGHLDFYGPGTLILNGLGTYGGGTNIFGGTLVVNSGAPGTGSGYVDVFSGGSLSSALNQTGTAGGSNPVHGLVTAFSGGNIAPGQNSILAIAGNLKMLSGSNFVNTFAEPNVVIGSSGGNTGDNLTQVQNTLFLNPSTNVNITGGTYTPTGGSPTAFGANGAYTIARALQGFSDNSNSFQGWIPSFTNWVPTVAAGTNNVNQYSTFSLDYNNPGDIAPSLLDLVLSTGAPVLTTSAPVFITQANGQKLDNYNGGSGHNNPVVTMVGSDSNNYGFYVVNQPYTTSATGAGANGVTGSTKTSSFSMVSNTVFSPVASNVNSPIDNTVHTSGFTYLSPEMSYIDPPYTPAPHYLGESFMAPPGDADSNVFLGAQVPTDLTDTWVNAPTLDTLPKGVDAPATEYQGSFLSLIDSFFPSITDPGQLTAGEWSEFNGSYGVDFNDSTAWAVVDNPGPDNYQVVGTTAPVPLPDSLYGGLALMVGMGAMIIQKRRRRGEA